MGPQQILTTVMTNIVVDKSADDANPLRFVFYHNINVKKKKMFTTTVFCFRNLIVYDFKCMVNKSANPKWIFCFSGHSAPHTVHHGPFLRCGKFMITVSFFIGEYWNTFKYIRKKHHFSFTFKAS